MKNFSPAKKLLLGLLAVFLTFIIIVVVIDFSIFDEELSPQVVETLKPIKMPLNHENAFFAIWGLSASSNKNMIKTGEALISRYRENRAKRGNDEITIEDYTEILGGKDFDASWQDDFEGCTARREYGCASKLAKQLREHPVDDPRFILMLDRYEQITSMTNFKHMGNLTLVSPLPPYGNLMKLHRIKIANAYNADSPADFIRQMSKDLKFWKMLLNNGNTLIDKMIAVASIWSNLQVISEYAKTTQDLTSQDYSAINTMLAPLTKQESDIGNAFGFEQQAFYTAILSMNSEQLDLAYGSDKIILHWLIQPNATINDYHQYFTQRLQQLSRLTAPDFYKTINATDNGQKTCCFKELESLISFSPSSLYNLGGKLLLADAIFQGQDYVARVHDMNGVISLVRLQLLAKEYPDVSIGELINRSETTNPYTGEPVIYDENEKSLGFECLNKGSFCKIKF